jgi:crossover junction endonuclease MUS81
VKDKMQMGMSKQDLIPIASKFCDKSFSSNPGSKEFYSAWDGHKQLEKHGLISISGRSPKIYVLTETGLDLAEKLKQTEGIESSPTREEANLSYDNGIRLSPESSFTSDVVFTEQSPPTSKGRNILLDSTVLNDMRPMIHDKENMILNRTKYKIWKYDEFDVRLIVDNREVKSQQERDYFQNRLETHGIKCDVRPLTLGDVLWIAKNKVSGKEVVLNCIGERKKMDDLCMSIKDGRFQEQKSRLRKSGLKRFYYIIEETGMNNDIVHEMMDSVRTAISMTMTSSKFYVRRFKDVDSTIQFLVSVTKTLSEYFIHHKTNLIVMKPPSINSQNEYTEILNQFRLYFETRSTNYECVYYMDTFQGTFEKSGMLTVKEMYILMLMTIRGVSLERAIVIQLRFPTPKLLLEFYHTQNADLDETAKKQLMEKEFSHLVGNKKIGKLCLERIYQVWGCR